MEVGSEFKVEITQLKISKPLLKVVARNVNAQTTDFLRNLKTSYDEAPRSFNVELGGLYIASISKTQFERCRVLQANEVDKTALVVFIDCGYQGTLRYCQLRSVKSQNIRSLKPLSREFVLANVQLVSDSNYTEGISKLHDIIVGKQVLLTVKEKTAFVSLVDLLIDGKSLVRDLIPNDQELSAVLEDASLESQISFIAGKKSERDRRMDEQGFCPRTLVESPEGKKRSFSFSGPSFVPAVGTDYDVRITAYEEGPRNFFVQFTSQDESFQKFQCNLQSYRGHLDNLRDKSIGAKCITIIDGQLHRATILRDDSSVSTVEATVRLMETGTKSLVPLCNIYAMPSVVANVQPFAMQFELDTKLYEFALRNDAELNFIFHRLTNNKPLKLRVVALESEFSSSFQSHSQPSATCNLYHNDWSIADECERWDPTHLFYKPQNHLDKEFYKAEVSYVDSPKEFYVHIHDKAYSRYNRLRDALNSFTSPQLRDPAIGCACVVKHITSNVRGKIVRKISPEIYKVEFVDFGFVDDFNSTEIRIIDEDFLKLPPFAYKCCLKEVANLAVSETFAMRFRDKVSRNQLFTLRIVKNFGDTNIVELGDACPSDENGAEFLDWTEAHSTFRTHFANRRRRERFDESDDDFSDGWTQSIIDVSETSENTLVGPQELPWQEHSASRNSIEWNLKTPTNKVIDLDEMKNWEELDSSSSTKRNQQLSSSASSATMSSGFRSFQLDDRPRKIGVRITAIESPTDFTVQKLSNVDRYKKFCDDLQKLVVAQQPMIVFEKDSWCLAYDANEEMWKRATIVENLSVRCLDTGVIFSVPSKSFLKSMAVSIRATPFFGIRCSLPIRVRNEAMANQCLINEKKNPLTCQLISEVEDVHFVELFSGDKNMADCMVERNCAVRLIVVPSGYAYISFVYSTAHFIVQMENSTERLNMITQYTDRYVAVDVKQPEIGALVLAFYPNENAFYRARIVAKLEEKFRVYLIDHGHDTWVDLIGEIDDPLIADIPPIAYKCSLALPQSNRRVETRFEEFAALGKTRVYVRTVKPGEKAAIVDILNESKENIVGWLLK